MARRTRTARSLAQRIDLTYFTRPHPFRRSLWIASLAAPIAAVLWLGVTAVAGSRKPYSSGPLAGVHAPFADRCDRCHVMKTGRVLSQLDDAACLACHDAPSHQPTQMFTPSCASCHLEHRGRVSLSAVTDRSCLQCHRSLGTTDNRHRVALTIGAFAGGGHPEFAATRAGSRDRTVLRFNHQVHLKRDLAGPNGPTTLDCATCHRLPARSDQSGRIPRITFAKDCASCHPLFFDPLIAAQTPHDTPDVVHRAVTDALRAYIVAHPDQIGRLDPIRRIPLNFPTPAPVQARTADDWVRLRTASAERLLWSKTCAECHDFAPATNAASLPKEIPTNMPAVWMPLARFDHRAHQLTTCVSCHAAAPTSRDTADVLLPRIATCQRCHAGGETAESRCFECHQYHDWARAKPIRNGAFDLKALTH